MLLCTSDSTCSVAAGSAIPSRCGDVAGGVELEPVGEHGQPPEHPLLVGVEQAVRPLDRRPHRAVAVVAAAGDRRAAGRSRSSSAPDDRGDAERRRPRRRQLDGQREAVEPPAELGDRRPVQRREVDAGRRGPLPEQLDGRRRRIERSHGEHVLTVDARAPHDWSRRPTARGRRGQHVDRGGHAVDRRARSCRGRAAAAPPASEAAAAASGSTAADARRRARAMVSATSSGSATQASSTNHTVANSESRSAAACTARRVLPTPPTPVSVTMRCRRVMSDDAAGRRRRARPATSVGPAGCSSTCRHRGRAGTAGARSGCTTCHTRSGSVRSRSRCVPRSVERRARRARRGRARPTRPRAGSGRRDRPP